MEAIVKAEKIKCDAKSFKSENQGFCRGHQTRFQGIQGVSQ